jgi:hypothetical protein
MSVTNIKSVMEEEKPVKRERKLKVQFDLTPESEQELDDLQKRSQSATRVETIRRALLLYGWFTRDVDPDSTIQVVKDKEVLQSFPASLLKGTKRSS